MSGNVRQIHKLCYPYECIRSREYLCSMRDRSNITQTRCGQFYRSQMVGKSMSGRCQAVSGKSITSSYALSSGREYLPTSIIITSVNTAAVVMYSCGVRVAEWLVVATAALLGPRGSEIPNSGGFTSHVQAPGSQK